MTPQEQLRCATEALSGLSHAKIAEALGLGGGRQRVADMLKGRRPVRAGHIADLVEIIRYRARAMLKVADMLSAEVQEHGDNSHDEKVWEAQE